MKELSSRNGLSIRWGASYIGRGHAICEAVVDSRFDGSKPAGATARVARMPRVAASPPIHHRLNAPDDQSGWGQPDRSCL